MKRILGCVAVVTMLLAAASNTASGAPGGSEPSKKGTSWQLSARAASVVQLIDMNSIGRDGDHVHFDTMTIHRAVTDGRDFDRADEGHVANCALGANYIEMGVYYRGGVKVGEHWEPGNIFKHSPGSIADHTLKAACGERRPIGSVIVDPTTHKWFE